MNNTTKETNYNNVLKDNIVNNIKKSVLLKITISLTIILLILILGCFFYNYFYYSGELIGINNTDIYHRDSCKFVKKANSKDLIFFKDLYETAEAEFRPCKSCNPPDNSKYIPDVLKKKEAKNEKKKADDKVRIDDLAVRIKKGEHMFLPYEDYKLLIKNYPELKENIDNMINVDGK